MNNTNNISFNIEGNGIEQINVLKNLEIIVNSKRGQEYEGEIEQLSYITHSRSNRRLRNITKIR